jgi:hypothetical protein
MLCILDLAIINYLKFKNFTGNLSGGEASSAHDLPLEIQKSEGLVDQTVSISLKISGQKCICLTITAAPVAL